MSEEELELKALKKELREVRLEWDILKKAVSIFSKSEKMRYEFHIKKWKQISSWEDV